MAMPKRFWKVTTETGDGGVAYATAVSKAKAVEAVEAAFGFPAGVAEMDVQEIHEADLPAGEKWHK